jgi:hypothetical protein
MSGKGLDLAEIERTALAAAWADLGPFGPPISASYWPKPLGRPYIYEMVRREFGQAGIEYCKTLSLMTLH